MSFLIAVFYGVVQGITEFLPISSTAHLTIMQIFFPNALRMGGNFDAFSTSLHLGTALAVVLFFIKDWIKLITAGISKPSSKDGRFFWLLVAATVPAGLGGLLLSPFKEKFINNIYIIGSVLIIMGIVLYFTDKFGKNEVSKHENIGFINGVLIGASQIIAMIPGVSRSGITISTGRFLGVNRESAAKFAFMLSSPIILLDGLYELYKGGFTQVITDAGTLNFFTAIITSFITGIIVIKFLLELLKKKSFLPFAVYRIVAGVVIIVAWIFINK